MIKKTEDLDIFKKHPLNRELHEGNVVKIMSSIKIKNLLDKRPILVNEKMEIVDGQHRLEACKRLAIPIFYEIEKSLESSDIILLNANQKSWSILDFIKHHACAGNKNYVELLSFSQQMRLSPILVVRSISRTEGFHKTLKRGAFQMPTPESEKLMKLRKVMDTHKDAVTFLQSKLLGDKVFLKSDKFNGVLIDFLSLELIDLEIFNKKLAQRMDLVCQRTTRTAYHLMWKEIYNYRNQDPLP